jgi:hypothetical protein
MIVNGITRNVAGYRADPGQFLTGNLEFALLTNRDDNLDVGYDYYPEESPLDFALLGELILQSLQGVVNIVFIQEQGSSSLILAFERNGVSYELIQEIISSVTSDEVTIEPVEISANPALLSKNIGLFDESLDFIETLELNVATAFVIGYFEGSEFVPVDAFLNVQSIPGSTGQTGTSQSGGAGTITGTAVGPVAYEIAVFGKVVTRGFILITDD